VIVDCLLDLGFSHQEAAHRAVLAYTAYIGLIQAQRASGGLLLPASSRDDYLTFLRAVISGEA
jgi:hypothetical protein